tara:strand:+ start:1010 stop:1147 length:138 start_codon:yes stop_codon:yes gene_type:complete
MDENPVSVYMNLKIMGGYYNYQQLTVGDFIDDASVPAWVRPYQNV